jgi:hypothetical protein
MVKLRRNVLVLAAALAVGPCVACGSASPWPSTGPVGLFTQINNGQLAIGASPVSVDPGQSANVELGVLNLAESPAKVVAVSVVAVPGIPSGLLAHAGLDQSAATPAVRGWSAMPGVTPLIGGELASGPGGILFGITGPTPGTDYAVAGLKIEYDYDGNRYTYIAWMADVACVTANWQHVPPAAAAACQAFTRQVNEAVLKMAGPGTS